jgi:hypothetical protein
LSDWSDERRSIILEFPDGAPGIQSQPMWPTGASSLNLSLQ